MGGLNAELLLLRCLTFFRFFFFFLSFFSFSAPREKFEDSYVQRNLTGTSSNL